MAIDSGDVPWPLVAYKDEVKYSLFRRWIEEHLDHGMFIHPNVMPVIIPQFGYSICSLTEEVIKEGSIITQTPKRFILSPRNVSSPELAQIFASDDCAEKDYSPLVKLTLAYIYECCQEQNSPWYGYLTSLCGPDTPFFWEYEELELLFGTQAYEQFDKNIVFPSPRLTDAGAHDSRLLRQPCSAVSGHALRAFWTSC